MATEESTEQKLQQSEAQEFDKLKDIEQAQMADDLNILNRVQSLEGSKVLDLGCGTGNYTYRLAERVGPTGRVVGVDPDKERIKIAREKWVRDNLTFMEGCGESFPEGQYDLIFSNYAIHYIENKQPTFERVYKNLRPGGQFAFVTGRGLSPIGEEISALMGPEGHKRINSLWYVVPAEKYKELAATAGFTVNLMEEDFDKYTFPSIEVLLSSWHGITDGRFDVSKVDPTELDKLKQKYARNKMEHKVPVVRVILTKS